MKHYKYKIITGRGWNKDTDGVCRELEIQDANEWKLVSVVGEHFFFRHEIEEYFGNASEALLQGQVEALMAKKITIEHTSDCPIYSYSGIIESVTPHCNCDFMQRLKAELEK